MTIAEMHTAFKIGMQDYASHLNRSFHPEEIDHYINEAIDRYVINKFDPTKNLGFEQTMKRLEDLQTIVVTNHSIDCEYLEESVLNSFDFDSATLPNDFQYLISIRVIVKDAPFEIVNNKRTSTDNPSTVSAKWIQQDDINRVLDDPFNTTIKSNPLYTLNTNRIDVFTDETFITDKVILNYLKKPATVSIGSNIDSDLSKSTHRSIIDTAVLIAKGEGGKLGPQVEYSLLNKNNEP